MKKLLVILLAGLLLFSVLGMDTQVVIDYNREADFLRMAEEMEETNPEWSAYYRKWASVDLSSPFPEEWRDKNGDFKEFVTLEMVNEKFHGSNWEAFMLDEPANENGEVVAEVFYVESQGKIHINHVYCAPALLDTYESCEAYVIDLYG